LKLDEIELQTKPIQVLSAFEWLIKVTISSGDTVILCLMRCWAPDSTLRAPSGLADDLVSLSYENFKLDMAARVQSMI